MTSTRLRTHVARAGAVMALVLAAPFVPAAAGAAPNDVSTVANGLGLPQAGVRVGAYLYVVDQNDMTVKRVDPTTGATVVYAGTSGVTCDRSASSCGDDGPATGPNATLAVPTAITADGGSLYIGEGAVGRVRRVLLNEDPSLRTITTFAGTTFGDSGDGAPAGAARMGSIGSLAHRNGRLYISDLMSNKIRCVGCTPGQPTWISTVVGTGKLIGTGEGKVTTPSPDGTVATNANIFSASALTFDPDGNLVFSQGCDIGAVLGPTQWGLGGTPASFCDGTVRRVRNNKIETVVGKSGRTGTGNTGNATGPNAVRLLFPGSVAYRPDGTMLVADLGISLLDFIAGISGDATLLTAGRPRLLCVGCTGAGKVSKIAGNGFTNPVVDGPAATATFSAVRLIDDRGTDVYFVDVFANALRKIEGKQPNLWAGVPQASVRANNPDRQRVESAIALNVQNNGQGGATGPITAQVTLSGPGAVTVKYASWSTNGWACTRTSSLRATCVDTRDLPPNTTRTINVWVNGTGRKTVKLEVSSPSREKNINNGKSTKTATVTR